MEENFHISSIIGRNIQTVRMQKGKRQLDVCEDCGIKQNKLSRIEHGATKLTVDLLWAIAKSLGVPPIELFAGVPDIDLSQRDANILVMYHSDDKFKALIDAVL